MTAHDPVATAGLSTAGLSLQVSADPHLSLSLVAQPQGDPLCKTQQARGCPVELALPGRRLTGDDFAVTAFFAGHAAVVATCAAGDVELRLSWTPRPVSQNECWIAASTPVTTAVGPFVGAVMVNWAGNPVAGSSSGVPTEFFTVPVVWFRTMKLLTVL